MTYPRSGYRTAGARRMAEASFQRAKASGDWARSTATAQPRTHPYGMHGQPRTAGSSMGELTVQSPVSPLRGEVQHHGSYVPRSVDGRPNDAGRRLRLGFGLLKAMGFSPGELIVSGLQDALNNLPGFSTPKVPPQFGVAYSMGGRPLYAFWQGGALANIHVESSGTINSQQTGQSTGSQQPPSYFRSSPGTASTPYVSTGTYRYVVALQVWREDEMATYGPAPVGSTAAWGRTIPVTGFSNPFPMPLPFSVVPYRQPGSWPQSNQGGYTAPEPATMLNPHPEPYAWQEALTELGTRPQPATLTQPARDPVVPPRTVFTPRRPPGKRVKETKLKFNKFAQAVIRGLGDLTELSDMAEAFWDALPKRYQSKLTGKPWQKDLQRLQDLYKNWEHVDMDTAFMNLLVEQIKDYVYGQMGLDTKSMGRMQGSNMGANILIGNALVPAAAKVMKEADARVRRIIEQYTDYTLDAG